jgi:hypothetical protein
MLVCCIQKDEARSSSGRGGLISPRKVDTHSKTRNKRRPPRGMYLNQEALMAFVSSAQAGQGDNILKKLEAELVELKRQVNFYCLLCYVNFQLLQLLAVSEKCCGCQIVEVLHYYKGQVAVFMSHCNHSFYTIYKISSFIARCLS